MRASSQGSRVLNKPFDRWRIAAIGIAIAAGAAGSALYGRGADDDMCPPISIHFDQSGGGSFTATLCAVVPIGSLMVVSYRLDVRVALLAIPRPGLRDQLAADRELR